MNLQLSGKEARALQMFLGVFNEYDILAALNKAKD